MGQIKVEKNVGGIEGLCVIEPAVHGDVNNPVPVSLLSGDRKPQIRFLGNHHSGSGNLYHKSFRM